MNQVPQEPEATSFGPFLSFFLFCSAADRTLLERCPAAERNKYASIGATVFFTGLLAALSGGYALYTVFNQVGLAIALGIFWGALVFNLDRFIVSTIKKTEQKWGQFKQVLPRLFLAIFLAIVISKPLELKIFEQEIAENLHATGLKKLEEVETLYAQKKNVKQVQVQTFRGKIEERFLLREKYYEDYKCECEGSCGTGAKGVGSECLRKEYKYHKADQEYQEMKTQCEREIAILQREANTLDQEEATYKAGLKQSFANGLMARLNALNALPTGPSVAIVLLLICIEIAPIFAKLLSPYGPYDHLLKTIEYDYEIEEISSINLRNQKLNNQLTLLSSIEQEKVEQEILNSKETIQLIEKAHQELVKEQLDLWVAQEKLKLRTQAMDANTY